MSFTLQDAILVDELTGEGDFSFFGDLHPRATDQVEGILDTLGFEMDALEREVADCSGGMKRKLEVAISLSVDVPLYLLGEPTAALDMTTVGALHSLLAKRRAAGETILGSSHLPTDAELADHVAFVTEEGVCAVGSQELLADAPTVVLAEGTADITENVREGRLSDGEIHRRGFLQEGTDPEAVTSGADAIYVREPTYLDRFNYYVHLRSGWNE